MSTVAEESQDVGTARFTPCFIPVIAALPAVIAALILLTFSLQIFQTYMPRWTKPFVQEADEKASDLNELPKHQPLYTTLVLLAIAAIGLALQALTMYYPKRQIIELYPSIAWVCSRTNA